MNFKVIFIAAATIVALLTSFAPSAFAGAQDTGELASCEIPTAKGIPILGNAGISVDTETNLTVATFKTLGLQSGGQPVVIRVLVGPDFGISPMEYVCQVLNGETAEGPDAPTATQQILAAVGLSARTIAITKRGIFGCDVLPCPRPGLHPDFGLVPGTAEATALGQVILFAVRP